MCQFTCHIVILQSINCSILRTLASFSNQRNSFRLDTDAIKLKGDHLVEGEIFYQMDALRLTYNRCFTRGSKLRVNIPTGVDNRRVMNKKVFATADHDFVYIWLKYHIEILIYLLIL